MTSVARATFRTTVRAVRMPRGAAGRAQPQSADAGGLIEEGYRHRAIGSLQALALALAASVLVTGLVYAAL